MSGQTIWVPFSVLNDQAQSANARLVWLLLCPAAEGDPTEPTDQRLSLLSGLCLKTVIRLRTRLARAPLAPCHSKPQPSCGALPLPLLTAANLSVGARLLYGQLQGIPEFAQQKGEFTYAALSHLTGCSDDALRKFVAELAATGWLAITQAHRKSPLAFTLRNPAATHARARLSSIRRKIKGAQHKGEALLRELLNALVALDAHEENAAPDFLLNPYTGELMELDRYYPTARVGFEFQGAQHFDVTDLADFEATVKQVGRDAMKAFICKARGIELVTICAEDLSRNTLEQRIPRRLPRRDPVGLEPLIALLEGLAADYREHAAHERARTAKGRPIST